ncbi:hypothetical protein N234_00070 [Ralstonia pickettii DTP0602]|nr:hypothetical protein N234_00070 [Ralstonia pickettii DTP0602]
MLAPMACKPCLATNCMRVGSSTLFTTVIAAFGQVRSSSGSTAWPMQPKPTMTICSITQTFPPVVASGHAGGAMMAAAPAPGRAPDFIRSVWICQKWRRQYYSGQWLLPSMRADCVNAGGMVS